MVGSLPGNGKRFGAGTLACHQLPGAVTALERDYGQDQGCDPENPQQGGCGAGESGEVDCGEGEEAVWKIAAADPDNDALTITLKNAPAGAGVNQTTKTITWKPTYEELGRSKGFFSNLLNAARLEHLFLKKKKIPLTVEVCGLELCTEQETQLIVYNTNRAPNLFEAKNLTIMETETIQLVPETTDPDGDFVSYAFSEPFGQHTGEWETSYEDEGTYTIDVTATDGKAARSDMPAPDDHRGPIPFRCRFL